MGGYIALCIFLNFWQVWYERILKLGLSIDSRILLHNLQNILRSTLDLWDLNLYESAKNGKYILQTCFKCHIVATSFWNKARLENSEILIDLLQLTLILLKEIDRIQLVLKNDSENKNFAIFGDYVDNFRIGDQSCTVVVWIKY